VTGASPMGPKIDALTDMVGEVKVELIRLSDRVDANTRDQAQQLTFLREAMAEGREGTRQAIDREREARETALRVEREAREASLLVMAEALKAVRESLTWAQRSIATMAIGVVGSVVTFLLVHK
jgi:hypothetical protein